MHEPRGRARRPEGWWAQGLGRRRPILAGHYLPPSTPCYHSFVPALVQLLGSLDDNADRRGRQFERISKWLLENEPAYRHLLRRVWLWKDWPGSAGRRDTGIDLVAEARDGSLWAVQSKAYDPDYYVTKVDLDSFLAASARREFQFRLVLTTTDHIGPNARDVVAIQDKPVHFRGRSWLESLDLDWPAHPDQLLPPPPPAKVPRPHQQEAISLVLAGLAAHDRGQLVMACGTGKTLVGLWVAERLAARRVLILVPSLALLEQTIREWCANAGDFELIAVCSDPTVVADEYDAAVAHTTELGIPVTTAPDDVRRFVRGRGRRVVFATYQSSPQVASAFSEGGKDVPPFDLAVADEAHRCAGRPSRAFATIIDAAKIPARKRLFMTATPRYFTGHRLQSDDDDQVVASMDDEVRFGPVFHRLSFGDAIRRQLLSDYRVAVVVLDDGELRAEVERGRFVEVDGTPVRDARSLAQQIALTRLMCDRDYVLRRIVTFHSRIKPAREFSRHLPVTIGLLNEETRPSGFVWAAHINGEMPTGERATVLDRLRKVATGQHGVVTNARCLTEGVDVPSLDGVGFLDPLRSPTDILQAVGRAIRLSPAKTVGTVLVPVYVASTDDPVDALSRSAFEPIWQVLRALRAHDEALAEQLDAIALERGRLEGVGKVRLPEKVRLIMPKRLELSEFVDALKVRFIDESTDRWTLALGRLLAFHDANGHARVPRKYVNSEGFRLGWWVGTQRALYERGRLSADRVARLQVIAGWTWDPYDDGWQEGLTELRAYREKTGRALAPQGYMTASGFALGSWVQTQRNLYRRGVLAADRVAALEAVQGWIWNPYEELFRRGITELRRFAGSTGSARVSQRYKSPSGFALGDWVLSQRKIYRSGRMPPARAALLEAIRGWRWNPGSSDDAMQAPRGFEQGLADLHSYYREKGHLRVPRDYRTASGRILANWVLHQRKFYRRGELSADRVAALEALDGWQWNPHALPDRRLRGFDSGLADLRAYVQEHGHVRIPRGYKSPSGRALWTWVGTQRTFYRRGRLAADRIAALQAIEGWTWRDSDARRLPKGQSTSDNRLGNQQAEH